MPFRSRLLVGTKSCIRKLKYYLLSLRLDLPLLLDSRFSAGFKSSDLDGFVFWEKLLEESSSSFIYFSTSSVQSYKIKNHLIARQWIYNSFYYASKTCSTYQIRHIKKSWWYLRSSFTVMIIIRFLLLRIHLSAWCSVWSHTYSIEGCCKILM